MNWQSLFTGILSILMVLDCVLLVLLVLLQLPKKEAGAGVAFGGAATDALFGAGSGNVLTKITKWLAGGFFVLAIALAIIGKPKGRASVITLAQPAATASGLPAAGTPSVQPGTPAIVPAPTPATTPATTPAEAPVTAAKPAAESSAPATSTNK